MNQNNARDRVSCFNLYQYKCILYIVNILYIHLWEQPEKTTVIKLYGYFPIFNPDTYFYIREKLAWEEFSGGKSHLKSSLQGTAAYKLAEKLLYSIWVVGKISNYLNLTILWTRPLNFSLDNKTRKGYSFIVNLDYTKRITGRCGQRYHSL